jgi:hypothetical protein
MIRSSLEKIAKLDFDYMLPGHLEMIGPNASNLLREFLKSPK